MASALGKQARGKPKHITEQDRERRRQHMRKVSQERWAKPFSLEQMDERWWARLREVSEERWKKERDKLWKAVERRYWNGMTVPRKIPAGRVLVHNPVQATSVEQPHGMNGFRVWTQKPSHILLKPCKCGWSGLPHYRVNYNIKGHRGPLKIGGAAFQKHFGKPVVFKRAQGHSRGASLALDLSRAQRSVSR